MSNTATAFSLTISSCRSTFVDHKYVRDGRAKTVIVGKSRRLGPSTRSSLECAARGSFGGRLGKVTIIEATPATGANQVHSWRHITMSPTPGSHTLTSFNRISLQRYYDAGQGNTRMYVAAHCLLQQERCITALRASLSTWSKLGLASSISCVRAAIARRAASLFNAARCLRLRLLTLVNRCTQQSRRKCFARQTG